MSPAVVVNGRTRDLGEVGGHVTLLDWLRGDGLTGARKAAPRASAAPARCWSPGRRRGRHPLDGDQRLPGPRGRVRRPGGGHRRGPRPARRPAPGAAGDGRPRRLPVRLLHAGFHLLDGRGVLPPGPPPAGEPQRLGSSNGHSSPATTSTARTASTCTRSAATCAAAPATGPIRDAAYALGQPDAGRPAAAPVWTSPAPAPRADQRRPASQGRFVRPASLAEALDLLAEHPDAQLVAGSTDWGVELNIRHAPGRPDHRHRPARRAARSSPSAPTGSTSAPPSRLSEIERAAGRPGAAAGRAVPAVRVPADPQRRDLGGNLGTGSPIGDTPPALLALDASLVLASRRRRARGAAGRATSPATGRPSSGPTS